MTERLITKDDVRGKLKEMLIENLGIEEEITGDAKLMGDLGADSLDITEMAMEIEEIFKVNIPDGYLGNLEVMDSNEADMTFDELVDHVYGIISAQK